MPVYQVGDNNKFDLVGCSMPSTSNISFIPGNNATIMLCALYPDI